MILCPQSWRFKLTETQTVQNLDFICAWWILEHFQTKLQRCIRWSSGSNPNGAHWVSQIIFFPQCPRKIFSYPKLYHTVREEKFQDWVLPNSCRIKQPASIPFISHYNCRLTRTVLTCFLGFIMLRTLLANKTIKKLAWQIPIFHFQHLYLLAFTKCLTHF